MTVTNRDLFFHSNYEFSKVGLSDLTNTFLLEPIARHTAAAIALAGHYAHKAYGADCILLILPADHLVGKTEVFTQALGRAEKLAAQGKLVTFGIKPSAPKTGYGYIVADGYQAEMFVEKPDKKTAETLISNGNCYWNSGMFCMRAGSILAELEIHAPDIAADTGNAFAKANKSSGHDWQKFEIQHSDFENVKSISIDNVVFEKSRKVAVVPCDFDWSDIGSWSEFGKLMVADEYQNNISGSVITKETTGCVIRSQNRLIAALGVKDLIISDTADALLVAHKEHEEEVRNIVKELTELDHPAYKDPSTVQRGWGNYTVLLEDSGFKIKRLEVNARASLSLQSHKFRSEHWVVVSGKAEVINGDAEFELGSNESTYIPSGFKHRLKNPGTEKLIIIEVQCGSYLGEDDIQRYEV